MFASLREEVYRLFLGSQLMATTAMWVQRIAVDWILMELTGDVTLVGLLVLAQFAPTLFLGIWGGVLVDRYSARPLLLIAQSVALVVNALLVLAMLSSSLTPSVIFAAAAALGIASIVDQPGRQVIISQIVPAALFSNAISMNSIIFQVASVVGPALGGILLAGAGNAWTFGTATALHLVAFAMMVTLFVRTRSVPLPRSPRAPRQIIYGLRYAWTKHDVRYTLLLLVFVCVIGLNWPVIFIAMTTNEFHSGAGGYSLANTALAAGSLVGALLSLRRAHHGLRTVIQSVAWVCVFRMISSAAPVEWAFSASLLASGLSLILMWTAANLLLQWSSNPLVRGRIMAIYLMVAIGGQALGGPLLGWACATIGPRLTLVISGALPLLAAGIIAFLARRRRLP